MGFEEATPVQDQAIPPAMEGRDLIACAQTGTGKTAAFLLPILNSILHGEHDGIKALIIAPTRELALQIDQQLEGFAYFLNVSSIAIYGGGDGMSWDQQKRALVDGADIVIATPGRLISHLNFDYVKLDKLKFLILDEADRMLDMGFHDDIMTIINYLPTQRQTMLFSATMPPKIRQLARKILNKPAEVNIAIAKPAEGIFQAAYLVYETQKLDLIKIILQEKDVNSIIIFSSTKSNVKILNRDLRKEGYRAASIHSDLEQDEREQVMLDFRNRKINVLVATNIVSRGIDIEGIDLIINYDVPRDAEDYIHRIGRTARAESTGKAITLINEKDQDAFLKIEKLLDKEVRKVELPDQFDEGPEYKPQRHFGKRRRSHGSGAGNKSHRKGSKGNKEQTLKAENTRSKHKHPAGNHPHNKKPWRKKKKNKKTGSDDGNSKSD